MISVAAFEHFYISWMFFFIKKKLGEKKFKRKCSILMSLPQQWLAAHRNPQVVQTLLILLFLSPRLSTEFLINRLKKFCFLCVRITVQVTVSPASCPGLRPDRTPDRGRESKNSQQGKENTMTLGWQVSISSQKMGSLQEKTWSVINSFCLSGKGLCSLSEVGYFHHQSHVWFNCSRCLKSIGKISGTTSVTYP